MSDHLSFFLGAGIALASFIATSVVIELLDTARRRKENR